MLTVEKNKSSYQIVDKSLEKEVSKDLKVYTAKTNEPFELYKKITGKKEIPYSGFVNESKPSFTQKASRFIRGNFFIPDARIGWNKYAFKKACDIIEQEKIDVVITTSPPHSSQLIGLKLKQKYKIKWIADIRDPWTDIYYYKELLHTSLAKKIDNKYERDVLINADNVIVVSKDIKRLFSKKSEAINPDKITIIPNGYDENDFSQDIKANNEFTITYTGTIAESYNIKGLISALEEVIKIHQLRLVFVGKIAESIKNKFINSKINESVKFIGYKPHSESIKYLLQSTILLLVIPELENNKGILTGKLFEYLASRKPILNIGPTDGDAAEIINYCAAGSTYNYTNKDGIKDFILNVINDNKNIIPLGNAVEFSRENLSKKFTQIIKKL